jgi:hypothetical protein
VSTPQSPNIPLAGSLANRDPADMFSAPFALGLLPSALRSLNFVRILK